VFVAIAAGCGDSSTSEPADTPRERSDKKASLPDDWRRVVNERAGFNFGIPPGWKAAETLSRPPSTIVRSRDRSLAVSITADRGPQGRDLKVTTYARRAIRGLSGYRDLKIGAVTRVVDTKYPAAAVKAEGVFERTSLRQALILFALKKKDAGTFSMLVIRSARVPRERYADVISTMVRTLRAQAPRSGRSG
jgi:hypothetical protein